MTETVGAVLLALPTAVAGIGPIAGVAVIALRRRPVVESRENPSFDAPAAVNVAAGEPIGASVRWPHLFGRRASGFHSAEIELPALETDDLRVWAHQLDPEGNSRDLHVLVDIDQDGTPPPSRPPFDRQPLRRAIERSADTSPRDADRLHRTRSQHRSRLRARDLNRAPTTVPPIEP